MQNKYFSLLIVLGVALLVYWLHSQMLDQENNVQQGQDAAFADKMHPESVLRLTNEFRAEEGLQPLSASSKLNEAARLRARDMIDKDYFAHNCPDSGDGAEEAAIVLGYSYRGIAENIAKGNYKSARQLVQDWMDSKGHRDNILHPDMHDMGIAVVREEKSIFSGSSGDVSYGVQLFARRMPDCIAPDDRLRESIEDLQQEQEQLQQRVERLREKLESQSAVIDYAQSQEQIKESKVMYNIYATMHNFALHELQEISEEVNAKISTYNAQAETYEHCLAGE